MEGPCCGLKGVGLGPGSGGARLERGLFRRGVWVLVARQGRHLPPGRSLGVLGLGIAALTQLSEQGCFTGTQAALREHILPTEPFLPVLIKPDLLQ